MQLGPGWFIFIDHTGRPQDERRRQKQREANERRLEKMRREDEEMAFIITLLEDE